MIWQNPWAWLGLAALAVPVLVHLLGRRSARAQRFPTLRFIEATPPVATRRTRLTDIPLMLVRIAMLAAAVAALAAPLVVSADRERRLGAGIARAIILDTSESVRRASVPYGSAQTATGGESSLAMDAVRGHGTRLASEARTSVVIETGAPASALAGASAWLEHQRGRRELAIVSDFQTGAIDSSDLAIVPGDIGIRLIQVSGIWRGDSSPVRPPLLEPIGLAILAGSSERARAEAAVRAAAALTEPARLSPERPVAIVHRGFESRAQLLAGATQPSVPWQGDLLVRLGTDPTLLAAAAAAATAADSATVGVDSAGAAAHAIVLRARSGQPIITAAADRPDDRHRLLLFLHADAGSLVSAALVGAVARATARTSPAAEQESTRVDAGTLTTWERAPATAATTRTADDGGESDGRWLWLLALALLGVESWLRRGRREVRPVEVVHESAA